MVALGGVVVDDVEDDLDPGGVQRLDHPLELEHLLAARPGRCVERVRREVADRAVAPVVREATVDEEALVSDVVDGHELDRGHAETREVRDRGIAREARVRAAQLVAHVRVEPREALHVRLVDDGVLPGRARRAVALPVEPAVDDDALRDRRGRIGLVDAKVGVRARVGDVRQRVRAPVVDRALDRLRVRVDQELRGVEPLPLLGAVRAVDAERVPRSRPDVRQKPVPVECRALAQFDPRLAVVLVEAELDALGVLREEREVRAVTPPRRAEREGLAGPDPHRRSSAVFASKSATSSTDPRRTRRTRSSTTTSAARGSSRRSAISSR